MSARRVVGGAAAAAAVALGLLAAATEDLGGSIAAAYRAFRDPGLLEPRPAPPGPPALSGACPAAPALAIAHDFAVAADEDLEDPGGASIASLTLPELRVPITRRTLRYVRHLTRDPDGRLSFVQRFQRSGRYRGVIEHALREAGLPEDLVWVAAVESGFDPRAASPAGAAGLWQFMPRTGALYGLEQSPFLDERRSITRATTAAVAHLRDLFERFGRWDLALAAYNLGSEGVLRAMRKVVDAGAAPRDGRPIELGDLAAAQVIPEETASYVPQIAAFALVAVNRARFGLDGVEPAARLELGEIAVPEGTRIRTIARASGVSAALIREYNPELLRDRVPPTGGDYLVALPAERVTRALAAFPAYLDQEAAGDDEAAALGGAPRSAPDPSLRSGVRAPPAGSPGPAAAPREGAVLVAAAGPREHGSADEEPDPLPPRPHALGRNRLPAFALPEIPLELSPSASPGGLAADRRSFDARLPFIEVGSGAGWTRRDAGPLGALGLRAAPPLKGREAAIEKELGFLGSGRRAPPESRFTLPSGVSVEVEEDPSAPRVAITVRVGADPGSALGPAMAGETRHTVTVAPRDLDVGIELAAGRLRMLLGEASRERLAAVRARAGEARRRELSAAPYGPAWITLAETLFPAGHPLEGTMIGAREDAGLARDLLLADVLRRERSAGRASVTVIGDVQAARARSLVGAALRLLPPGDDAAVGPHPREERVVVEQDVPETRALFGWIAPAEHDAGDASMRVAMEILAGARIGRLERELAEPARVAASVRGVLDLGARASVAAIEITPAVPHGVDEVEARLTAAIQALATAGPGPSELALATALLRARLSRETAGAGGLAPAGAPRSATSARVRNALEPGSTERTLAALDEVTASTVRAVVKRSLGEGSRVVVITRPREPR